MQGMFERPCHIMQFAAQLKASNLTETTIFSLVSKSRDFSCVKRVHCAKQIFSEQEMSVEARENVHCMFDDLCPQCSL